MVNKEKKLLFEIGTEEMPPSSIKEGTDGLKAILESKFEEGRIRFDSVKTYSSPRRLVALVDGLAEMQDPEERIVTGPPVKIAFNDEGMPTEAAKGFAKSLGFKVDDLEKIKLGDKGLYLGKKSMEEGKKTKDLLPGILKSSILSLNFSKQMTWGNYDISFIRPIRWILALYGSEVVNFKVSNLKSSNITFGHSAISPSPVVIKDSRDYFKILEDKGKVIVDAEKRKKIIIESIRKLEENLWKGKSGVVLDRDLLGDVVNMVEIPNVIAGSFPEKFLYIPKDLLIEAIQHHQKYFAVVDSHGNVSTNFIIIQNGVKDKGGIKKGNERVLKARLSDAAYFYEEDRKHDFSYWTRKLKGVIFFSGLGNMYDKSLRLKKISSRMAKMLKESGGAKDNNLKEDLERASMLCKCDLVTSMVVEFPSLQGIVGRQYAEERGERAEVSDAVSEHYLPRFSGDMLPLKSTGLILAIADKIDTITGMFIAGKIPTGSADPFALRRKASGIVLSVLKGGYDFSMDDLINFCIKLYLENPAVKNKDRGKTGKEITDFIIARFKFMVNMEDRRRDVLESVLGSGCSSIVDIGSRFDSLEEFIGEKDIKKIYFPMVRCKNIMGRASSGRVDSGLFKEEYEKTLFSSIEKKEKLLKKLINDKDYKKVLLELYKFGKDVDVFFDEVLVMDKNKKIRSNRVNLVKRAFDLYMLMADFSKLVMNNN
ncbi:MAG: glycine--tRNA ligase subunit beta [Actinomycetota bacterium]|nr:glycine--tRNA ligase subunit beta [Actinomycetota bacterium]